MVTPTKVTLTAHPRDGVPPTSGKLDCSAKRAILEHHLEMTQVSIETIIHKPENSNGSSMFFKHFFNDSVLTWIEVVHHHFPNKSQVTQPFPCGEPKIHGPVGAGFWARTVWTLEWE